MQYYQSVFRKYKNHTPNVVHANVDWHSIDVVLASYRVRFSRIIRAEQIELVPYLPTIICGINLDETLVNHFIS